MNMNVSRSSGKAFLLQTAGWSLGEVARGLVVTKSTISRVSLDEDKAVMGDLVKVYNPHIITAPHSTQHSGPNTIQCGTDGHRDERLSLCSGK